MKTTVRNLSFHTTCSRRLALIAAFGAVLAVPSLTWAALPTPCTAVGHIIDAPFPGNTLPKGTDGIQVRNFVFVVQADSPDPLVAGRKTVVLNGDLPGSNYGTVVHELGTWDLTNPAAPAFTPTGAYWEGTTQGTSQTDWSVRFETFYHGHGGAIEGLVYTETTVRGSATGPDDRTVPLDYTGTYATEDSLGLILVDDFASRRADHAVVINLPNSETTFTLTNEQAVLDGHFYEPSGFNNTAVWGGYPGKSLNLSEGKTAVLKMDIVSLSGPSAMIHLAWLGPANGLYIACAGRDFVAFDKWQGGRHTFLFVERPSIPLTNVVFSLTLCRQGDDVLITTEVRDKGPGQPLLFTKTVADTPAADPCVTGAVDLDGGAFTGQTESTRTPWTALSYPWYGVWQQTDGRKAAVRLVVDNFQAALVDLPPLSIDRAVRLTWPATAFPFHVETAPTLETPASLWQVINEPVIERNGLKQMSLPTTSGEPTGYFRLR